MYKKGKNLRLLDEKSIFIGDDVVIGDNVTIYENNRIDGKTIIGDGCVLLPNNYLVDCVIGAGVTFNYSQAEGAEVGDGTAVGPFARLRPKAKIGKRAKIGNFVITGYCTSCNSCGPRTTSTGNTATEGVTVAVNKNQIQLGTKIIIGNHVYIAEDIHGNHRYSRVVDVFFGTRHGSECFLKNIPVYYAK